MRALSNTIKRIARDVGSGKNLESYVITLVAVIFAVFTLVEDSLGINTQMAILLAGMAILIFKTTEPKDQSNVELDAVLLDRQSFGPFRDFIKGGQELLIYAPSAVNVLTNAPDIEREILSRGGSMRVIIQDPKNQFGVDILHKQLDQMSHLLENDIQRSCLVLEGLRKRQQKVDYKLLPFSPGYSLTVIDPDGRDGRLIVEFFGFASQNITDRMHIVITRQQSQYWFEYWAGQFEVMWKTAAEPPSN